MTVPLVPRSRRRRPWPPRPLPGWKMCRRRYAHDGTMLRCTAAEGHRDDHTFLSHGRRRRHPDPEGRAVSPFYMRAFLQPGTEILWCVVERKQDTGILEIWASGSTTPGFEGVMRRAYTIMAEALNAHGDELEQLIQDVKR